jgi:hypothetical protein
LLFAARDLGVTGGVFMQEAFGGYSINTSTFNIVNISGGYLGFGVAGGYAGTTNDSANPTSFSGELRAAIGSAFQEAQLAPLN